MAYSSGTTQGYRAEYRERGQEKWESISMKIEHLPQGAVVRGVPFPMFDGGILSTVYLMGKEQANALAWGFAASWAATQPWPIEVRVVPFKVKYSIEYEPEEESAADSPAGKVEERR